MNQSGGILNEQLRSPKSYADVEQVWQELLAFMLARSERERIGLVVLLLAILLLLPGFLIPALFSFQLPPLFVLGIWLVFGLFLVWVGSRLDYILCPERWAFQQIIKKYDLLVRQVSDREILLDRITYLLYQNLGLVHLSIWRYQAADRLLTLSRWEGKQATRLTELPLDLNEKHLHHTRLVSSFPASALRQGLAACSVQAVTALQLGDELVGFIGLGRTRFGDRISPEILRRFDGLAGQLALAVKSVHLIADLEDTLQKLQLAYRRSVEAEEQERRHLAVELHDEILSRLTTLRLTLGQCRHNVSIDPARVQHWLEMLEQETQTVSLRLREITQGLYPSVLVDLGLMTALQAYLDSLAKRSWPDSAPDTITLTAQGFSGDRLPEPNLERDLYFVIRQALDNAIAHAQAGQVLIHLRWREDAISVTVQDNGCGMAHTPEQLMGQDGHLGLLSMNERVLAWQGRLTFKSGPGRGTTVHVHIPIDQPSFALTHLQASTHRLPSSR